MKWTHKMVWDGQWSEAVKEMISLAFWSFLNSCEDIILGSHKEGGATTFWSYTLNLPLSSNSMISWKFCYLLHKLLRDGHKNVRSPPAFCLPLRLYHRPFTRVPFIFFCLCLIYRLLQILTDTVATSKIWASSGWVAAVKQLEQRWHEYTFLLQTSHLVSFKILFKDKINKSIQCFLCK